MVDYHIHSDYSTDSYEKLENILISAINKNLDEIMLTDHFEFDGKGGLIPGSYPFDEYIKIFDFYKEKYRGKINLKLGIELGVEPHVKLPAEKLLSRANFEYIIGSSHNVDKKELYYQDYFVGKDKYTAYLGYFKEVLENIKLFDEISVYGHFDYIARYGIYEDNSVYYHEFKEIIDEIILEIISRGKGFEVNVSGYKY
ncbi:MAG: histidinol-phosphatase HisJ family protein, partial [Clostridiales bacterium]|nr:histidinol-phosphatase HisJ family protein [Clostridiales bacterium]